jgi:ABC-2 type transport system permease protein
MREDGSGAFGPAASLGRIEAVFLRHFYLMTSSWPRVLELVYWPTVQVTLWGFIALYLMRHDSMLAQASGLFLSAVLLWDTFFRSQLGVSVSFLEEMWARNLGQLFVSPLRPWELVVAMFAMSLVRTLIGVGGAALLAIPIHGFDILDTFGPLLVLFFAGNLLFGWALGLVVSGLVLRLGLGAESLAWALVFLIQPVSAVYYPLDVLPGWLQAVGAALPPAHVFEGMRALLLEKRFDGGELLLAFALDAFWMAVAATAFLLLFASARRRGLILQVGE